MENRDEHARKALLERRAMLRICELIAQGWPAGVALDLVRFPDDEVLPELPPESEPEAPGGA